MNDKEIVIIVMAAIFVLLFAGFPMMGFGYYGGFGMMSGLGFDSTAFFFMAFFWILIVAVLVLFIIWLIKQIIEGRDIKIDKRRAR